VQSKSIFVGNLPYEVEEDEIATLFNEMLAKSGLKQRAVEGVRVVTENGRTKGFGYVDFTSLAVAKKALEIHAASPLSLQGRSLRLDVHTGKKREGFHYRPEAYKAKLVRPAGSKDE
jgi:nucleolin